MQRASINCQLREIDENLIRSELSATQQAEHLAKRKELWAARDSVASCNTKPGRPKGFDTDTAEKTGVNRSTINRAISRAENVTDEARDAIRGTDLDRRVVLDELKRLKVPILCGVARRKHSPPLFLVQNGISVGGM